MQFAEEQSRIVDNCEIIKRDARTCVCLVLEHRLHLRVYFSMCGWPRSNTRTVAQCEHLYSYVRFNMYEWLYLRMHTRTCTCVYFSIVRCVLCTCMRTRAREAARESCNYFMIGYRGPGLLPFWACSVDGRNRGEGQREETGGYK